MLRGYGSLPDRFFYQLKGMPPLLILQHGFLPPSFDDAVR